jgi:hypothetical protein
MRPKNLYVVACIVIWTCVAVVLLTWHKHQHTISYVAATNGLSHSIFGFGMVVSAMLTYFFLRGWFFENVAASSSMRSMFYVGIGSMIVAGVLPASAGLPLTVHKIAATLLAVSLLGVSIEFMVRRTSQKTIRIRAFRTILYILIAVLGVQGIPGQIIAALSFNVFILGFVYYPKVTKGMNEND